MITLTSLMDLRIPGNPRYRELLGFDTVHRNLTPPRRFLVIDHNPDSGSLLVRSLARKFPQSVIQLAKESGTAAVVAATERLDAVVLHRTLEDSAVELVRMLRNIDLAMPIVVVSGVDRSEEVLAAGASGFLNYDEWLMVGTFVANAVATRRSPDTVNEGAADTGC